MVKPVNIKLCDTACNQTNTLENMYLDMTTQCNFFFFNCQITNMKLFKGVNSILKLMCELYVEPLYFTKKETSEHDVSRKHSQQTYHY